MKKVWSSLVLIAMIVGVSSTSFAVTVLHQLGQSPFFRPPLKKVADLRTMVATSGPALKKGFEQAGYPDLYPVFAEQFPETEIEEITVTKGEHFLWMLYRKNGRGPVRVARDVTWDGSTPFQAFRFYLERNNQRFEIIVPYICGNLALRAITGIVPAAKKIPVVKKNIPPTCKMAVISRPMYCGGPVTVDASASSDGDGAIYAVTISMLDDEGKAVEEKTITTPPFIGTLILPCDGEYTVQVRVTDDQGAVATSPACTQKLSASRRFVPVAAVGFMHLVDPANFVAIRSGLEYRMNEQVSLLAMLGYNFHLDGKQGDDALSADLLAHYHLSRYFFGAGIGWWNMDDDSYDRYQRDILDGNNLDLILQAGARLYGGNDAFNVSVFGEARSFVDSLDELHIGSRFTAGLLFRF